MLADLAEVDAALHPGVSGLLETLKKFRPADLGRDLSRRDLAEALDDRRAAQMLGAAHPAAASNVLETLDAERATRVVSFLPMDCQVAILGGMDAASRARVEAAVDPAEKAAVDHVLSHGPSSVARLMTPRSRRVTKTATVGEALARLRGCATARPRSRWRRTSTWSTTKAGSWASRRDRSGRRPRPVEKFGLAHHSATLAPIPGPSPASGEGWRTAVVGIVHAIGGSGR